VHSKGPAAQAGLRAGDVVVSIDGKEVQDPRALQYRFATKGLGGAAELGVIRQGKPLKVTVALVAAIEDPPRDTRDLKGRQPLSGAKVANLSPAVAEELGIEDEESGVVVVDVAQDTPAAKFGFRRGDILVGVNDNKVTSVKDLAAALERSLSGWRLSFEREGKVFSVAIQG